MPEFWIFTRAATPIRPVTPAQYVTKKRFPRVSDWSGAAGPPTPWKTPLIRGGITQIPGSGRRCPLSLLAAELRDKFPDHLARQGSIYRCQTALLSREPRVTYWGMMPHRGALRRMGVTGRDSCGGYAISRLRAGGGMGSGA